MEANSVNPHRSRSSGRSQRPTGSTTVRSEEREMNGQQSSEDFIRAAIYDAVHEHLQQQGTTAATEIQRGTTSQCYSAPTNYNNEERPRKDRLGLLLELLHADKTASTTSENTQLATSNSLDNRIPHPRYGDHMIDPTNWIMLHKRFNLWSKSCTDSKDVSSILMYK